MVSSYFSDLLVFSHLRWDFVFQRPQHLLTRFARKGVRVFYFEEPVFDSDLARLEIKNRQQGVRIVVPHLPRTASEERAQHLQRKLLDKFIAEHNIEEMALWLYTPMALPFTAHLQPQVSIYDCMDELSLFQGAHPQLLINEDKLFKWADVVFTGGQSLYEHKKDKHSNIHAFPSSIDYDHFVQARCPMLLDPNDQRNIAHPRIGFFGVIDERMDRELLAGVAAQNPDWHFIVLGPVTKIDAQCLPQLSNIHYLGKKTYGDLPNYIAKWDVAMLPFARNDATRFISPTKTPEYLAAGKPVVSTTIRDVVEPYGRMGLVHIADTVEAFSAAIRAALAEGHSNTAWCQKVDAFLAQMSWDATWQNMVDCIDEACSKKAYAKDFLQVAN